MSNTELGVQSSGDFGVTSVRPAPQMDRTVASVLWFALCVGMEGVESTGAARSAPPRSSDAGARSLLRDYTELLYRSLSILQPGHGNGSSGSANTVTAFIDKGTGWSFIN